MTDDTKYTNEPEEKLLDFLKTQFTGITILRKNQLPLPLLTLLYSTIDILAYVWAGGADKEASKRFIGFTLKYIIKYLKEVNEVDLWGARCAIIHTATPESTVSIKGNARKIVYSWGSARIELLKEIIKKDAEPHKYIAISIDDLFEALGKGIDDFLADLVNDEESCKDCMDRVKKFYALIPQTN
jgi:hypothetical protein